MKVRAIEKGFYDHSLRHPGHTFHLSSEEHFSDKWMEPVEGPAPVKKASEPKADAEAGASSPAKGGKKGKAKAEPKADADAEAGASSPANQQVI